MKLVIRNILVFTALSANLSFAASLEEADKLFKKREVNIDALVNATSDQNITELLKPIEAAKAAYQDFINSDPSEKDLVFAVERYGRLTTYQGSLLYLAKFSDKSGASSVLSAKARYDAYSQCKSIAAQIAGIKAFETEYLYWFFSCTALMIDVNNESGRSLAEKKILGGFLFTQYGKYFDVIGDNALKPKAGSELDFKYMAGGIYRLMAKAYLNPFFKEPTGISDTAKLYGVASEFAKLAVNTIKDPTKPDPMRGDQFYANHRAQVEVYVLQEKKEAALKALNAAKNSVAEDINDPSFPSVYLPEAKHDLYFLEHWNDLVKEEFKIPNLNN